MHSFFEYIKCHKKLTVFLFLMLLAAVFFIPFLINVMFKQESPCNLLIAEWDAGDALNYYGAVLSFLSTTILSVLALWQNHVIKSENDKHTALLERMEKEKNAPFLIIDNIVDRGNAEGLSFSLKNISESIAQNVTVDNFCIKNLAGNVLFRIEKEYHINYLDLSNKLRINLANLPNKEKTHQICFKIQYYDIFGEAHKCNVVGVFKEKKTIPHFNIKED